MGSTSTSEGVREQAWPVATAPTCCLAVGRGVEREGPVVFCTGFVGGCIEVWFVCPKVSCEFVALVLSRNKAMNKDIGIIIDIVICLPIEFNT